ncbi:MAG: SEC-C metal-binding domain-containing protein [Acidimicrobiia bacterium]
MDLDRGVLARIDRKLLASLGGDETFRMVRVPATAATWSTWKRYCNSAGISMGRAIEILIGHELVGVLGDSKDDGSPVFAAQNEEDLARRAAEVARREQELETAEDRLRAWQQHLRQWESDVEARQPRTDLTAKASDRPEQLGGKVGRNEPCPCGSGRRYKRCHGSPADGHRRASGEQEPMG